MPVTVKVNGVANSLVHKGSNGISIATIPDVCKTPSPGGPVPIPYPNISQSTMLAKGTTTVKADGGMMIAVKGSEFSLSNGDNPGVAGGVKSSTFMKESTWILYSFDVKMDGKNACRLSDKKFHNHENTVNLGGELQIPKEVAVPPELQQIADCCNRAIDCDPANEGKGCTVRGTLKHSCCKKAIDRRAWDNVTAEQTHSGDPVCRLDVQVPKGSADEVTNVYDFKFNCSRDPYMSDSQLDKYSTKFPNASIEVVGSRGAPKADSKAEDCAGAKASAQC
jgi:hypothetical protein